MCYRTRSKACEWVFRVVLEVRRITNGEGQWLTFNYTYTHTHTHNMKTLYSLQMIYSSLIQIVAGVFYAGITWELTVTFWNTKSIIFIFLYLVPECQFVTLRWGVSCTHGSGTTFLISSYRCVNLGVYSSSLGPLFTQFLCHFLVVELSHTQSLARHPTHVPMHWCYFFYSGYCHILPDPSMTLQWPYNVWGRHRNLWNLDSIWKFKIQPYVWALSDRCLWIPLAINSVNKD